MPITGGRFWGGPGFENFCGKVRPGGADRQLLRRDGVKELRAQYEMEADDGTLQVLRPQREAVLVRGYLVES